MTRGDDDYEGLAIGEDEPDWGFGSAFVLGVLAVGLVFLWVSGIVALAKFVAWAIQ